MKNKIILLFVLIGVLLIQGCNKTNNINNATENLEVEEEVSYFDKGPISKYNNVKNLVVVEEEDIKGDMTFLTKVWTSNSHHFTREVEIKLKEDSKIYIYMLDGSKEENIVETYEIEHIDDNNSTLSSTAYAREDFSKYYYLLFTQEYKVNNTIYWETFVVDVPYDNKYLDYEVFSGSPLEKYGKDDQTNLVWNYFMSEKAVTFTDNIYDSITESDFSIIVELKK